MLRTVHKGGYVLLRGPGAGSRWIRLRRRGSSCSSRSGRRSWVGDSDCGHGCTLVTRLPTKLRSPTARASPATARSAHSEALLQAHAVADAPSGFHRTEGFRAGHCRVPRASARHRRGHVHARDLATDHDRVRIHVAPFRLESACVAPRRSRTCGPAPASVGSARRRTSA